MIEERDRVGQTNYAQRAAESLVELANALHSQHIKPASDGYISALRSLRGVDLEHKAPLDATLKEACELFLLVEKLAGAVDHSLSTLRGKIGDVFAESGCPGIYLAHHRVIPVEGQPGVIITDEAALAASHPDLMTQPNPASPDRRAIVARLRNREPVTGAVLSNEAPKLSIRFTPTKNKEANA